MITVLRVMGQSMALGIAEFRTLYTIRSWLAGWLTRMLAQVAFFGTLGLLLHSSAAVQYLLIGNAVLLVCFEAIIVVMSMAGERFQGTLVPLLSAANHPAAVLLGRGLNWVMSGMITSFATLAILPPVFGVPVSVPRLIGCIPILAVIGVSGYLYGSFLGGLVLRFPQMDWLVLNVGYVLVMTFAGVNVPVSYWPAGIRAVANVLPVTHGLQAIRTLIAGGEARMVVTAVAQELLVAAGWAVMAMASYGAFARNARRNGTAIRS